MTDEQVDRVFDSLRKNLPLCKKLESAFETLNHIFCFYSIVE